MSYPRKNEARVSWWSRKLDFAAKQVSPLWQTMQSLRNQYFNEANTIREKNRDSGPLGYDDIARVKPSVIFGFIDQSIANALARNPRFRVKDQLNEGFSGENFVSSRVTNTYEDTGQFDQDKRMMLDAYFGYAVKKIGYTIGDIEPEPEFAFDTPGEENEFLAVGDEVAVQDTDDHIAHNEEHGALLSDPDIDEDIKEFVIKPHMEEHDERRDGKKPPHYDIKKNAPFGLRWIPEHFLIDPLSQDGLKDARWIAFKSIKTPEEVRANPNYSKSQLAKMQTTERVIGAPDINVTIGDDDFGLIHLWEIWARDFPMGRGKFRNMLIVIAEQGEGEGLILRHDDEWPPGYSDLDYPAEILTFHKGVDTWMSKPLLHMGGAGNIAKLQNEMLDSIMATLRKTKNVLMYDSNIFEEDAIIQALSANDNQVVGVPGLMEGGGNGIQFLPFLQSDLGKSNFIDMTFNLMDRAVGTPVPGVSQSDSATEASIVERRTSARESSRVDEFEDMQIRTARKMWLLDSFFSEDDDLLWQKSGLQRAEARDLRFSVDVSSRRSALAQEEQKWMRLLNLMAGMVQTSTAMGLQPPDLPKIAEQLLVRGFDIQNPNEIWPAISETNAAELSPDEMFQRLQALQGQNPNGGGAMFNGPQATGPLDGRAFSEGDTNEVDLTARRLRQ